MTLAVLEMGALACRALFVGPHGAVAIRTAQLNAMWLAKRFLHIDAAPPDAVTDLGLIFDDVHGYEIRA